LPIKLADLFEDVDPHCAGLDIAGVTSDSRKVKPGFLFVAIAGAKADGALLNICPTSGYKDRHKWGSFTLSSAP